MVLLIDNFDSFSYNLYQMIGAMTEDIVVVRNTITVPEIKSIAPSSIVLSPGPGKPKDAGVCIEAVQQLGSSIPMLGVCLGHQAICEAYGGVVSYARELMHGKQSLVTVEKECPLFADLPKQIPVARYHSLACVKDKLPDCLHVTAYTEDGEIMAVQHNTYPVFGLQFHPESILTPNGKTMLQHFLEVAAL